MGHGVDKPLVGQIDRWIVAHRDDLIGRVRDLVAFPTISPPGRNTGDAQRYLADWLRSLGCAVEQFEVYPGDPDVVGRLPGDAGGGGRSLLFNGHIDVAEVATEGWRDEPFAVTERDGRLYGRGVCDMKGGLAAALFALQATLACGDSPRGDVIIESVIGEESGEWGTVACVERGYRADLAIVPEPTGLRPCGQGGVITGWVTIQSSQTLHDAVRARTIHAGGGLVGANAIEKMTRLIAALNDLERDWAVTKAYPGFAPGATTINPAVIEGGRHPAFMADRCALWITVHFYPDETWEGVVAEIEEHLRRAAAADRWLRDNPPTFRWGGRSMIEERGEIFPAVPLGAGAPGLDLLGAAHAAVRGAPPERAMWPSVSDAGWLARAGIPTIIYGPGELAEAHTTNESIAVTDLVDAARVYAGLIGAWCGLAGQP
ncbi:MAG: Amidohydrolase YlmB, involved in salvage of thiamin pyrimidine moiety [uncultured Thermomicrobiales bacterium]|uniref:Probable succinyl-diaminopimelate desuccinylase n=1 Tax=uncultured Thermomicrobiales bacterium TaxID=1645740 RepID=A0A6J4V921_9BACT|nr:MAG: Amidohydrolase YlmB, involved in salvage of thiamin pyrimidine moiety [uncultured Thermomicrobiales bacterium]